MNDARWDKRAWLLAFGGGNLCALIAVNIGHPYTQRVIDRLVPSVVHGVSVDMMLTVLFAAISLLLLPILLSATAQRFYLFWGLIPGWLVCFWGTVGDFIRHDETSLNDTGEGWLAITLGTLLLICGPISLYRFTRRRKAERIAAQYQAMQDARIPQEGVWPPPPRSNITPAE